MYHPRGHIAKGGNVKEKNDKGNTALHMAAHNGHVDVCKILVDNDADVEEKGNNSRTALHVAAVMGHVDVCDAHLGSHFRSLNLHV